MIIAAFAGLAENDDIQNLYGGFVERERTIAVLALVVDRMPSYWYRYLHTSMHVGSI